MISSSCTFSRLYIGKEKEQWRQVFTFPHRKTWASAMVFSYNHYFLMQLPLSFSVCNTLTHCCRTRFSLNISLFSNLSLKADSSQIVDRHTESTGKCSLLNNAHKWHNAHIITLNVKPTLKHHLIHTVHYWINGVPIHKFPNLADVVKFVTTERACIRLLV